MSEIKQNPSDLVNQIEKEIFDFGGLDLEGYEERATEGPWSQDENLIFSLSGKGVVVCERFGDGGDIDFVLVLRNHAIPLIKALKAERDYYKTQAELADIAAKIACNETAGTRITNNFLKYKLKETIDCLAGIEPQALELSESNDFPQRFVGHAVVGALRFLLGTYTHYKGEKYTLITIAKNEATGENMAVYQNENLENWVRPMSEFVQKFRKEPAHD